MIYFKIILTTMLVSASAVSAHAYCPQPGDSFKATASSGLVGYFEPQKDGFIKYTIVRRDGHSFGYFLLQGGLLTHRIVGRDGDVKEFDLDKAIDFTPPTDEQRSVQYVFKQYQIDGEKRTFLHEGEQMLVVWPSAAVEIGGCSYQASRFAKGAGMTTTNVTASIEEGLYVPNLGMRLSYTLTTAQKDGSVRRLLFDFANFEPL